MRRAQEFNRWKRSGTLRRAESAAGQCKTEGAILESLNGAGELQWVAITNQGRPGELLFVGFQRPDGAKYSAKKSEENETKAAPDLNCVA